MNRKKNESNHFQINEIVDEILLNSIDLNLTKIKFQQNHLEFVLDGSVKYNEEYEQARIQFNQSLNVS